MFIHKGNIKPLICEVKHGEEMKHITVSPIHLLLLTACIQELGSS